MYNLLYHLEIAEDSFITQLKKENEKALEYVIDNYGWI
jgi:RNA polymerase sigma-70 factor (ECF subfamily)